MDGCSIFREELAIRYPNHGHALWEPDPDGLYDTVDVGDVGFIRNGYFHRLFNALDLEGAPSDPDSSDGPKYPPKLQPQNPHHIRKGRDSHQEFFSNNVTRRSQDIYASGPDDAPFTFECSGRQGALLYLPFPAEREETTALGDFSKWIVKNIDECLKVAEYLGCGVSRMEDIILVTGRHLAKSWISVAFSESRGHAEVSCRIRMSGDSGVRFSVQDVSGGELKLGPTGENLPENQCIFVQGYRVVRLLKFWPRIRAAGSAPDMHEPEPESDVHLESIGIRSDANCPDPLHTVLEYIAEQASDCDMVLVHDSDVGFIGNALGSDTSMEYIRKHAPAIRQVRCGLGTENWSKAKAESVMVATLSQDYFEAPHEDQNTLELKSSQITDASKGTGSDTSPINLEENAGTQSRNLPRHMPVSSCSSPATSSPTSTSSLALSFSFPLPSDCTMPCDHQPSLQSSDPVSSGTSTGQADALRGIRRLYPTFGPLPSGDGLSKHDDLRHLFPDIDSSVYPPADKAHMYGNVARISGHAEQRASYTQPSSEAVKDEWSFSSPDVPLPSASTDGTVQSPSRTPPAPPTSSSLVDRPQKKRGKLPKPITDFLKDWLHRHSDHPYPSEDEKNQLCAATGLSTSQVSNWMINARRRILAPTHRPSSGPATIHPLASQRGGAAHSGVSTGTLLRRASMPTDTLQLYHPLSLQSISHAPSGPVSSGPSHAPSSPRNIIENRYGGGRSSSILGNDTQQPGGAGAGYTFPTPASLSSHHQPGYAMENQHAPSYISSQGPLPDSGSHGYYAQQQHQYFSGSHQDPGASTPPNGSNPGYHPQ